MRRPTPVSSTPAPDLDTIAVRAGEAWAHARAQVLRDERRPVVGGWPGTLTEARAQVLAAIAERGARDAVSVDRLRALSRTAYGAARTTWLAVSGPDDEP